MSKDIFVAPCVGSKGRKNFEKTVREGVSKENIPQEIRSRLHELDDKNPIWGTSINSYWSKVKADDIILFYTETGKFSSMARVTDKVKNEDWGKKLWPNYNEDPWDGIILLEDLSEIELELETFNEIFDYKETYTPQGFARIASNRIEDAVEKFGGFAELERAFRKDQVTTEIPELVTAEFIKTYIEYYNNKNGRYDSVDAEEQPVIKNVFKRFRDQVGAILEHHNLFGIFGIQSKSDLRFQFAGGGRADKYPDWLWVYPSEESRSKNRWNGDVFSFVLISGEQKEILEEKQKVKCFVGLGYKFRKASKDYVSRSLQKLLSIFEDSENLSFYRSADNREAKGEVWDEVDKIGVIEKKLNDEDSSWPHYSIGNQRELDISSTPNFLSDLKSHLVQTMREIEETTGNQHPTTATETQKKLKEPSLQKVISRFHDYIESEGFYFEYDQIKNFVLSLKTKPFVILAGISGTGKTKLAQLFAEFVGHDPWLISVKPNWTDNSDLLGYQNLQDEFQKQTLTEVLIKANKEINENKPHFVILDEMNLARVEHYFSDFLSKMETRSHENGQIKSEPIFEDEFVENLKNYGDDLRSLRLKDNLYIIGTVNMDETTHPFSRKVLDRANSLEFSDVELNQINSSKESPEKLQLSNEVLKPEFVRLIPDLYKQKQDLFDRHISELETINEILRKGDFQVGYRVRDELCLYIYYAERESILSEEKAFDFQLKQKILPRLQGSTDTISNILEELYEFTTKQSYSSTVSWSDNAQIHDELNSFEESQYRFPRSARKILRMQRRYLDQTFTSFWV